MIRIAAASLVLLAAPDPAASAPHRHQQPRGWQVSCTAGTDEFASNCVAQALRGPFRLELATGDSQLYLTLEARTCPAADAAVERNWWRDEVAGLSAPRRRVLLSRAVNAASETLARRCPGLAGARAVLGAFPDIAVFGDP